MDCFSFSLAWVCSQSHKQKETLSQNKTDTKPTKYLYLLMVWTHILPVVREDQFRRKRDEGEKTVTHTHTHIDIGASAHTDNLNDRDNVTAARGRRRERAQCGLFDQNWYWMIKAKAMREKCVISLSHRTQIHKKKLEDPKINRIHYICMYLDVHPNGGHCVYNRCQHHTSDAQQNVCLWRDFGENGEISVPYWPSHVVVHTISIRISRIDFDSRLPAAAARSNRMAKTHFGNTV